jgi:hypothetical protein
MTLAGTPKGTPPASGDAAADGAEHEPELSRLERKMLEAYAAPAPALGAVDAVLAALFAAGDGEGEPAPRCRSDGLAPRR